MQACASCNGGLPDQSGKDKKHGHSIHVHIRSKHSVLVILKSILPIFLALGFGYGIGRVLPARHASHLGKLLTPLIWLMLFFCGKEFGHMLDNASTLGKTVETAVIFAFLTTLVPWGLILFCFRYGQSDSKRPAKNPRSLKQALRAGWDCLTALTMLCAGVMVANLHQAWLASMIDGISTGHLLYLLIILVGVDLVQVNFNSAWRSPAILAVPLLVVIGSMIGGVLAACCTGETISTSLALASGFGWVTLSSILVGSKLGVAYGAIALLTDLFRELMAIIMLYLLGSRFTREAIGICGATALDATLPLIKQKCGAAHVSLALISGFILTIISPVLILAYLPGQELAMREAGNGPMQGDSRSVALEIGGIWTG